jgi:transcriptional regulator
MIYAVAKRDSLQGALDLLVLKALSRRPGLHGYALMTAIQTASSDVLRVEEGSLYPALHRMEENGWLRAEWMTTDGGRRIRAYRLTSTGRKQLATEESRWQQLSVAVNRVLKTV